MAFRVTAPLFRAIICVYGYNSAIMPITTIFFDLGSTLIYCKDPWPPFYERADRELTRALNEAGIPVDSATFYAEFGSFLDSYYVRRGNDPVEVTTSVALEELLAQKGFRSISPVLLRQALDALYAVTQQNWFLEADALPTLETLRQRRYALGLISNTSDDMNVQQLVDRWGLRPYFEFIVTSAGCGIRKPDRRIFQLALDHFGIRPEAAVMVGDTPEADIQGANDLGIHSIWITRRSEKTDPAPARPDATIRTLEEIPALLARMDSY